MDKVYILFKDTVENVWTQGIEVGKQVIKINGFVC
jgi:hypothetical protein